MNTRVGIAVDDMGGELARRCIEAATRGLGDSGGDFVVFSESTPLCAFTKSLVPRFPLSDCWGYSGLLVTTSLKTLELCGGFPRTGPSLHYAWEPDWGGADFFKTLGMLRAGGIVVRSASHADILESTFAVVPVGTTYFPDFEYFAKLLED